MNKNINDILFIVQARLGSERVPGKMLRFFGSSNLCEICLEKVALSIIPPENFYFSVYEEELKAIAEQCNVKIFHRSRESSQSEGESIQVIYEWFKLKSRGFKYVIMISACHPLLSVDTIDKFIEYYLTSQYDSLFSVTEQKNYFWYKNGTCINKAADGVMNTKSVSPLFVGAHCLYASTLSLIEENKFMGDFNTNNPELFCIPENESLDIDYEWQFEYYNILYNNLNIEK